MIDAVIDISHADGRPVRTLAVLGGALPSELARYAALAPDEAGQVKDVPRPGERPERLLLVGTGDGGPAAHRLAGAAIARAGGESTTVTVDGLSEQQTAALVEGAALASYRFGAEDRLAGLALDGTPDPGVIRTALAHASAGRWARELTNTPSSTKTPAWLGEQASAELEPLGVDVTVRDEAWLAEHRFGGMLAVGGGSQSPPRLIHAQWRPGNTGREHIVLVGKGITFDTGGLNLKPGSNMRLMHTDMGGGAAVLAAVRTVAALDLPVRVSALVPAAENSMSGSSYRPGDIVRHFGGRTTEVLNTDAEGRMVLADAMAYAVGQLRPDVMVDVATLTGAMKVALGLATAGMQATDDELAAQLSSAGDDAGEPLWRFPFPSDYDQLLESSVADANNAPGNPGGITAGMFLRPFTGGLRWAHLDIAGPARASADSGFLSKGATGFGARLLSRWLAAKAQ